MILLKKSLILLVLLGLLVGLSGCIGDNKPEFVASKYSASIMAVDDVTNQHPELLSKTPGWYDPLSQNMVSRYVDTALGYKGRRMAVYLISAEPPSLHLIGFLTSNGSYYGVIDSVTTGYVQSAATVSGLRVWAVTVAYDTPPKEEIPLCAQNPDTRCMGLGIVGTGNSGFDIRFAEPVNQLFAKPGFS